jgi:hypothetical protein
MEQALATRCLTGMLMTSLSHSWDLRSLWEMLSGLAKIYFFLLFIGSLYSLYSLVRIAVRVYRRKLPRADDEGVSSYAKISRRLQTLRQFHWFLFLSFGLCCANELILGVRASRLIDIGSYDGVDILDSVLPFAFSVMLVLLLLHTGQWMVASYAERASARE